VVESTIFIDLQDVINEFNLPKGMAMDMIDNVIKGITARFAREWEDQAKNKLKSSRAQYIKSLYIGTSGMFEGHVALLGTLPNMIEQGADPFDMKLGFAQSSKRKEGKNGWYLTIPFRHGTPGILGESAGFSNVMPAEIYKVAKGLQVRKTYLFGASGQSGESLKNSQIPAALNIPATRPEIITKNQTFEAYVHKSSIYQGMQRNAKQYGERETGQYITFRRVSQNSDRNAFIHKGIKAFNFAEAALRNIDIPYETDILVDNYLDQNL